LFLLDTDHLGIIQRQTQPEFGRLMQRMAACRPVDFYVSVVSFHEQVAGWNAYRNRAKSSAGVVRAYVMFQGILADFVAMQVVSFGADAAEVFESLRSRAVRIGTMDLRIAAVALARGLTLLSRNLVDFEKVPGLVVEDWTAATPRGSQYPR
jgi:tRNA(fMet)-specific endonuclease VapC